MAASTLYAAEYDLVFYPDDNPNNKEYSLTYTVPDVPETIESVLFDEKIPAFNASPPEDVKRYWTYPATDIPSNGVPPVFSHIKEARFIETIRTPIQ